MTHLNSLSEISQKQIAEAVEILKNEDVVGMPTETVYGLAGRIDSQKAIQKIFQVKERPFFDPLIVHVSSVEQAQKCVADWSPLTSALAEAFWPGPLTLVLPKAASISDLITSGLATVGLRFPQHALAQALIEQVGVPLAAPSANKFGRTSPTTAAHVREEFQKQIFVIDGDSCEIGIESTVLLVKSKVLSNLGQDQKYELSVLRRGAILQSQIDSALQKFHFDYAWVEVADKKESPGHMKHHYMPSIPFIICRNPQMKLSELTHILNQRLQELPDIVEGVQMVKPTEAIRKIEFLKLSKNPVQAAREIYAQLRSASQRKPDALCLLQLPEHNSEEWQSIFDRLNKAASLIID